MWQITIANGVSWKNHTRMSLPEALVFFYKVTGSAEDDIKEIINLH